MYILSAINSTEIDALCVREGVGQKTTIFAYFELYFSVEYVLTYGGGDSKMS